jgi:hypothetical protein
MPRAFPLGVGNLKDKKTSGGSDEGWDAKSDGDFGDGGGSGE